MHRQSLKPASLSHHLLFPPHLHFTSPLYRHEFLLFQSRLSGGDGNRQLLILSTCNVVSGGIVYITAVKDDGTIPWDRHRE